MCLLPLIAGICLASPENLSLSAEASRQVSGNFTYYVDGRNYGGATIGETRILMDVPVSRSVMFQYGWLHRSLMNTNGDRGEERAVMQITWRPFARASL